MSRQDLGDLGFEEQLDELDHDGNLTGRQVPYFKAHEEGIWHQASHVWIFDKEGKVLLQKRGKTVFFAGLLDTSAGGHIKVGQTPREAAKAELREELGIEVEDEDLYKAGVMKVEEYDEASGWTNNEFEHVFLLMVEDDIAITLDGEVEDAVWIDQELFMFEVHNEKLKGKYVPHGEYYDFALALIRQRMKQLGV